MQSKTKTIEIKLWPSDWKTERSNYLDDSIVDVEKNESKGSSRPSTNENQSNENNISNQNTQEDYQHDVFEYQQENDFESKGIPA